MKADGLGRFRPGGPGAAAGRTSRPGPGWWPGRPGSRPGSRCAGCASGRVDREPAWRSRRHPGRPGRAPRGGPGCPKGSTWRTGLRVSRPARLAVSSPNARAVDAVGQLVQDDRGHHHGEHHDRRAAEGMAQGVQGYGDEADRHQRLRVGEPFHGCWTPGARPGSAPVGGGRRAVDAEPGFGLGLQAGRERWACRSSRRFRRHPCRTCSRRARRPGGPRPAC